MKYRVEHGLADPSRVRTVVEKAYESYEQRLAAYRPQLVWATDRSAAIAFMVMSQAITAALEFDETVLRIDGKVPFMFLPFQKKIETVLGREMDKWLEKARNGEI